MLFEEGQPGDDMYIVVAGEVELPQGPVRLGVCRPSWLLRVQAQGGALLSLRVSARTPCECVRERAMTKLADIDRRITELQEMRGALARLADGCANGSASGACPILDELSRPLDNPAADREYP